MRKPAVRSARPSGALALVCGVAATLAAAAADAQRIRDGADVPRGPAAKAERAAGAMSVPPPPPPTTPAIFSGSGLPPPGPVISLPGQGMQHIPGPNNVPGGGGASTSAGLAAGGPAVSALGGSAGGRSIGLGVAPSYTIPILVPPGPKADAAAAAPSTTSRITEIIPATTQAAAVPSSRREPVPPSSIQTLQAAADACVNVYLRTVQVDGREVVSVDLHGDGLVKGAAPPALAGELLARAGAPSPNGTRAACVSQALAQSLFAPVVNVAAVAPAMRMARDGDRWVLAATPMPAARAEPPLQLASAATVTRGAAKAPRKPAPAKPRAPAPVQVAYWIYL